VGVDFKDMTRINRGLPLTISGNTFPVKEVLKNYGCQWDPQQGIWRGNLSRSALMGMVDRILLDKCPAGIEIIIPKGEDGKKETIKL
jgi:hypothetical protein